MYVAPYMDARIEIEENELILANGETEYLEDPAYYANDQLNAYISTHERTINMFLTEELFDLFTKLDTPYIEY